MEWQWEGLEREEQVQVFSLSVGDEVSGTDEPPDKPSGGRSQEAELAPDWLSARQNVTSPIGMLVNSVSVDAAVCRSYHSWTVCPQQKKRKTRRAAGFSSLLIG